MILVEVAEGIWLNPQAIQSVEWTVPQAPDLESYIIIGMPGRALYLYNKSVPQLLDRIRPYVNLEAVIWGPFES